MLRSTKTGMACLFAATALAGACQNSRPPDASRELPQPLRLDAQGDAPVQAPAAAEDKTPTPTPAAAPTQPAPKRAPLTAAPAKPAPASLPTPSAATPPGPPSGVDAHDDKRVEDTRDAERAEGDPIVTTISGCLERNRSKFRLTDMVGEHAPKSRSWKTGFFRKGSAKLELVAETDRLQFEPHVGYRVAVTGALFKKVMHARALNPTAARCS